MNDYNILLMFYDSSVYAIHDFAQAVLSGGMNHDLTMTRKRTLVLRSSDGNYYCSPKTFLEENSASCVKLLDNCMIDERNKVASYGLDGDTVYDFTLVSQNGEMRVETFEEGTRTFESKEIVLQPIN